MAEDFSMVAGTNRTIAITVKDKSGDAVDITAAQIVWVATLTPEKELVPSIKKSTVNAAQILVTDGPNGKFEVYLVPDDTDDKAGVTFYHEARTILATVEEVVHQGQFIVTYTTSYGEMPP